MSSYTAPKKTLGDRLENGITSIFVGFMASLTRLFQIKPHDLKRPGTRPNAPPPTGGISSLG